MVIVPAVADQLVAPEDVNCCVTPRSRLTVAGEMVCGGIGFSVTLAVADPPGPAAVTVTSADEGMVEGALYKPDEEIVPALAFQLVAPLEVNCSVSPRITVADVGEMTCGGTGVVFLNWAVKAGPHSVPGLTT